MRVREIIEAFDTDLPAGAEWEQVKGQTNVYLRDPAGPGRDMVVGFKQLSPDTVEIGFARVDQQGKWSQDRTGTGGASTPRILGQVVAASREFLARHPEVTHVAVGRVDDDPKKIALYRRMSDKLAPELGLTVTEPLNVPKAAKNMSIVMNRALAQIGRAHV